MGGRVIPARLVTGGLKPTRRSDACIFTSDAPFAPVPHSSMVLHDPAASLLDLKVPAVLLQSYTAPDKPLDAYDASCCLKRADVTAHGSAT